MNLNVKEKTEKDLVLIAEWDRVLTPLSSYPKHKRISMKYFLLDGKVFAQEDGNDWRFRSKHQTVKELIEHFIEMQHLLDDLILTVIIDTEAERILSGYAIEQI